MPVVAHRPANRAQRTVRNFYQVMGYNGQVSEGVVNDPEPARWCPSSGKTCARTTAVRQYATVARRCATTGR